MKSIFDWEKFGKILNWKYVEKREAVEKEMQKPNEM